MVVFDVKPVPIHAGSMRFYVCKRGSRHATRISPEVDALRARERERGFDRYETFREFSVRVARQKDELLALLARLRAAGKRIAGYGASGRANTMIQYCGLTAEQLEYMIDDAPAKIGFFTPGSHFVIRPSSVLAEANPPDYLLIFAWSFFAEIRARNGEYLARGGKMILPLPEVSIYPAG
jgi:methylation protein EvaC